MKTSPKENVEEPPLHYVLAVPAAPRTNALLSPDVFSLIRELPGNKHRHLGVQFSVVKSLQMDEWDDEQVRFLLEGGNDQFKVTISKLSATSNENYAHNTPISNNVIDNEFSVPSDSGVPSVYLSSAATAYRSRLLSRVKLLCDSCAPLPPSLADAVGQSRDENPAGVDDNRDDDDSVWPWEHHAASNQLLMQNLQNCQPDFGINVILSSDSPPPSLSPLPSVSLHTMCFPEGPLGMTLSKEAKSGRAFVSKLVRGDAAHLLGVRVYDFVEEVNAAPAVTYQAAMLAIQSAPRPISITFSRKISSRSLIPLSAEACASSSRCNEEEKQEEEEEEEGQEVDARVSSSVDELSSHFERCSNDKRSCGSTESGAGLVGSDVAGVGGEVSVVPEIGGLKAVARVLETPETWNNEGATAPAGDGDGDRGSGVVSKDFRVVFATPPLGITVIRDSSSDVFPSSSSSSSSISAPVVVNKVMAGSQAEGLGVVEGDCVVGVDDVWVAGYEDFIRLVSAATYPLTVILRRQTAAASAASAAYGASCD